MRIAFTGVSHWHIPLYLDPALQMPGWQVVGVADPDLSAAQRVATQASCTAWSDWRTMCDRERPDFVFVLGRHCDMAVVGHGLVARSIPFAIEKPCGIDLAEVSALAQAAEAAGVFAAVPFVLRQSEWMQAIAEVAGDEAMLTAAFKFVGGSVERYRQSGCAWMLERRLSGGGALTNLGIHFLDLARVLFAPVEPKVVAACFSNLDPGLDTEEHALVLLRAGAGACVIETGYTYPARHMSFDLHYSLRSASHYFNTPDGQTLEITAADQTRTTRPARLANPPYYPAFVRDVVARAAAGKPPVAGLRDMESAMSLLHTANGFGRAEYAR